MDGLIAVKSIAKSQLRAVLAEAPYLIQDVGEYQISVINITLTLPEYKALESI